MQPDNAWKLADLISHVSCESSEEAIILRNFEGSIHVVCGFGFFLFQSCQKTPKTTDEIIDLVASTYEPEPDIDLRAEIEKVMRQLHGLGIIAPCQKST